MVEDQRATVGRAPPQWLIPWITRAHVWVYEVSRGCLGARVKNMNNLILRGQRRKSGAPFAVCLPYWIDDGGQRIIVASFAGATKNPAWFHNVKDTRANPTVQIRDGAHTFSATAQILDGNEYDHVWGQICADRPFYAEYQSKTTRRIPLVRILEAPA